MNSSSKKRKKSTFSAGEALNNSKHFVTTVHANDVLLGRGAIVLKNEGNIRFRQLILANKVEYNSTGKHAVKDRVARRILKTIIDDRGGKFLRKIEDSQERDHLGITTTEEAWLVEGEEVCLLKVKQALREQESSSSSTSKIQPNAKRATQHNQKRHKTRTATKNIRRYDDINDNTSRSVKFKAVKSSTDNNNKSKSEFSSPLIKSHSDSAIKQHREVDNDKIESTIINSPIKPEHVPQHNLGLSSCRRLVATTSGQVMIPTKTF